jgi:peroxiredoxin
MTIAAPFVIVAALLTPQARPITATTGAPQLTDTAGTTFPMTAARYDEFVEKTGKTSAVFVPITRKPAALSARATFGMNLILRGHNLCWALDGDDTHGYVLYADWNGNGDLTDDTPLLMRRGADGKYEVRVEREEKDTDGTYPVSFRLVVDAVAPPGKTEKQLALHNYSRTTRAGVLEVPGAGSIAFRLTGSSGFYNESFHLAAFDLNGDGSYDADTEVFRVSEKYVNVGDFSYAFSVDPHGRSVTLTPLAEHVSGRVSLAVGSKAPDFSFTDVNGRPHRLSDYRGKVVLLDFWGAWCAPCVAEAPKLVALYDKFHDRGLEILGLDTLDTREQVAAFVAKHDVRWVQTSEPDKGPLQTLYRIQGWPSYLLIDRDGTIKLAAAGSSTNLDREVAALMR